MGMAVLEVGWQLYALGCRIDSVDRAIKKLNRPSG